MKRHDQEFGRQGGGHRGPCHVPKTRSHVLHGFESVAALSARFEVRQHMLPLTGRQFTVQQEGDPFLHIITAHSITLPFWPLIAGPRLLSGSPRALPAGLPARADFGTSLFPPKHGGCPRFPCKPGLTCL